MRAGPLLGWDSEMGGLLALFPELALGRSVFAGASFCLGLGGA